VPRRSTRRRIVRRLESSTHAAQSTRADSGYLLSDKLLEGREGQAARLFHVPYLPPPYLPLCMASSPARSPLHRGHLCI
jgi:hypothetical protein